MVLLQDTVMSTVAGCVLRHSLSRSLACLPRLFAVGVTKDDLLLRRDVHTIYFVVAKTEQESYHVRTPTELGEFL